MSEYLGFLQHMYIPYWSYIFSDRSASKLFAIQSASFGPVFQFKDDYSNLSGVWILQIFTVTSELFTNLHYAGHFLSYTGLHSVQELTSPGK